MQSSHPPKNKNTTNPTTPEIFSKGSDIDQSIVLCPHCLRTNTNEKRCLGYCVADSEY